MDFDNLETTIMNLTGGGPLWKIICTPAGACIFTAASPRAREVASTGIMVDQRGRWSMRRFIASGDGAIEFPAIGDPDNG